MVQDRFQLSFLLNNGHGFRLSGLASVHDLLGRLIPGDRPRLPALFPLPVLFPLHLRLVQSDEFLSPLQSAVFTYHENGRDAVDSLV
jgi:hypothetical protein